jgi:hypothetical protein
MKIAKRHLKEDSVSLGRKEDQSVIKDQGRRRALGYKTNIEKYN